VEHSEIVVLIGYIAQLEKKKFHFFGIAILHLLNGEILKGPLHTWTEELSGKPSGSVCISDQDVPAVLTWQCCLV
jgi:hypothetical protein